MKTPVFLSSLPVNSRVHSFMQTDVGEREADRRTHKEESGPIKLCTWAMPQRETTVKNARASQNTFELLIEILEENVWYSKCTFKYRFPSTCILKIHPKI